MTELSFGEGHVEFYSNPYNLNWMQKDFVDIRRKPKTTAEFPKFIRFGKFITIYAPFKFKLTKRFNLTIHFFYTEDYVNNKKCEIEQYLKCNENINYY